MKIRIGLVASACAVLVACGSSEDTGQPTKPGPVPTAAPTATPAPTPAPTATPQASNCQVPAMRDHGNCAKTSSRPEYRVAVNAVIDELVAQRPDLFDFTNDAGGGSWLVVNRTGYIRQVQNRLDARGFCTAHAADELGLKHVNDFNEQWSVITSKNHVRRAYITTCTPAAF